ncbi:MAG: hypothetical protein ACTSRA_15205, partial [Promethearchaeota archaeon]
MSISSLERLLRLLLEHFDDLLDHQSFTEDDDAGVYGGFIIKGHRDLNGGFNKDIIIDGDSKQYNFDDLDLGGIDFSISIFSGPGFNLVPFRGLSEKGHGHTFTVGFSNERVDRGEILSD